MMEILSNSLSKKRFLTVERNARGQVSTVTIDVDFSEAFYIGLALGIWMCVPPILFLCARYVGL